MNISRLWTDVNSVNEISKDEIVWRFDFSTHFLCSRRVVHHNTLFSSFMCRRRALQQFSFSCDPHFTLVAFHMENGKKRRKITFFSSFSVLVLLPSCTLTLSLALCFYHFPIFISILRSRQAWWWRQHRCKVEKIIDFPRFYARHHLSIEFSLKISQHLFRPILLLYWIWQNCVLNRITRLRKFEEN